MAGFPGKQAYLAAAKQTGKGAASSAAKHVWPFVGGTVGPNREVERLQETDTQRSEGSSYVKSMGVQGNPEVYVRDNSVDFLLAAALGAVADSGADPNYAHAITPASALPYLTVWRGVGGALFEQFTDMMVSELTIKADAGNPLTAQATFMGLTPTRLTADPSGDWTGVDLESGTVYTYNDASVTLAGGATSLISSFELTISNNVTVQQTDDVTPFDVVPGTQSISLSFDMIFADLAEYNKFNYGGAAGTTASSVLYTTAANFTFSKGANNEVTFDIPVLAYEEFPVEPQPDGSPIVVSVRAHVERNTPLITATVKNQKATTF